ncbi:ABC transporter ATP-binding protein [Agromyces mediolanus]|uniref:ABC transporter n=1 Tax=Agromyces mediolanus TaxID=41986 RepID=A0A918F884_AGRME|nr:ABC transporter ATP-binding protein [Agromyces mediolanus]GGR14794.1 ABC transporter [Agromyces mediolanus]GLJ73130.1 ABC transporter [Agromyces mediolanus]
MTTTAAPPTLHVDGLTMAYGASAPVFADVELTVAGGEIVCIVGPSGVGKTTLLRCLSGLLQPRAGEVRLDEARVSGPPREIGLVFQDYSRSLMPWMTALDNVAFPLQGRGVGRSERDALADAALAQVGLGHAASRYPWQLSGGMQQRVAIARALAYGAPILIMDEPFASVDAQTRLELEDLVLELRRTLGLSVVIVTHDVDEAVYLSDRIVVLAQSPARVVEVLDVELGAARDQLATRATAEFSRVRTAVLTHIREGTRPAGGS